MRMSGTAWTVALGLMMVVAVDPAKAQDRSELISQARAQTSDSLAMDLLMRAANPDLAPRDSLWAVSVHDLALTLIGLGDEATASLLLRWSARHGADWPVDRTLPPPVVDAYDQAVAAVQSAGNLGDPGVTTDWQWPAVFDASAAGGVTVNATDPTALLTVQIDGQGQVSAGEQRSLAPGTYEFVATAEGFEPASVSREVLPGVTTVLQFDLAPVLPPDARAAGESALVSIRYTVGGQQVCTTGFMGGSDGLVLTSTRALGQTSGLEVTTAAGVFSNVSVAASDPALALSILQIDLTGQPVLAPARGVTPGDYVWSVFQPGCAPATSARSRLADWVDPPTGTVGLSVGMTTDALGGPLIDRAGRLVGVVVGANEIAPLNLAERLLSSALTETEPEQAQIGGGGPPWKWIGAGALAAGVAAVVLLGGGDDGGAAPTTGSITITFPGGGAP